MNTRAERVLLLLAWNTLLVGLAELVKHSSRVYWITGFYYTGLMACGVIAAGLKALDWYANGSRPDPAGLLKIFSYLNTVFTLFLFGPELFFTFVPRTLGFSIGTSLGIVYLAVDQASVLAEKNVKPWRGTLRAWW